jgi:hypothetical protein
MCNKQSPISAFIAGGGGGGGSVNTGVLQTLGGGALSGTLQTITDQSSNQSPFRLSTGRAGVYGGTNRVVEFDTISGEWLGYGGSKIAPYQYSTGNFEIQSDLSFGITFSIGTTIAARIDNSRDFTIGADPLTKNGKLSVKGSGGNIVSFINSSNVERAYITSAGALISLSEVRTDYIQLNGTVGVYFNTKGSFAAPSDGVFKMANNANTNFDRLQFGGTTNAFPAIKRNSATIEFKLADDSAFCSIIAQNVESNNNLQLGGLGTFRFGGTLKMQTPSSGVLLIGNDALNDFNRLQLGGTTNAFPAIKRNSAAIDFRLADDSAFCGINTLFVNVASTGRYDFGAGNIRLEASSSYNAIFSNYDGVAVQASWTTIAGVAGSENRMFVGATGDASAKLAVTSTTKGFLPPRMTTTQRGNIVSPATALQLYNTTTNNIDTFDGTNWQSFGKETKITGSLEVNIASGKVINAIEVSSAMGLGFYNAAAIIQPVTGGASATYANVSGTEIKENDTFDGYTIGNVVKALRDLGLLA